MSRPLDQLRTIAATCPIVYVGDITDKWNSPPELINYMLHNLPRGYSVYGNHDLPYHDPKSLHRSAYYTLVQSGHLTPLVWGCPVQLGNIILHGFPFGSKPTPLSRKRQSNSLVADVAVVHAYVWRKDRRPWEKDGQHIRRWRERLKGFDCAVFGDNHCGWISQGGNRMPLSNCGTFMRRKMDERDYRPFVTLVHPGGELSREFLDCSQDKFIDARSDNKSMDSPDLTELLDELAKLGDAALDFAESLKRAMEQQGVKVDARELILKALEGEKR